MITSARAAATHHDQIPSTARKITNDQPRNAFSSVGLMANCLLTSDGPASE
ncbi:hypothetical protein [Kibdelosporangium persicum]|uniref:hypothetical protein n=1 Tax=Kibdelosporangium persicum TaxID=2698649 RepID=UPI0015638B0C|nr:hypothetical protein [Kibdelosporangium persicum]